MCLSAFQNTLPTSEKLSAATYLIAISVWFLLQCFRILGAPRNLDMFCSFYEESDFREVKAQRKTWLWYIIQQTK